jgi:hypothetical protein
MKAMMFAAALTIWGASAPAQTQSANRTASAGLGRQQAGANEELNIRAYIELLRTDIRKTKSQLMGEVMQLDADESAKFWPIYKEFEGELGALGNQVVAVVKDYALNYDKMNDDVADRMAKQVLNIEQQRNGLKSKYYERMKTGLGAVLAMRFLQVENQLERLIDLQIAAELPVVTAAK